MAFCEVHVTRWKASGHSCGVGCVPHRGYHKRTFRSTWGFFAFVHNVRQAKAKRCWRAHELLVSKNPGIQIRAINLQGNNWRIPSMIPAGVQLCRSCSPHQTIRSTHHPFFRIVPWHPCSSVRPTLDTWPGWHTIIPPPAVESGRKVRRRHGHRGRGRPERGEKICA